MRRAFVRALGLLASLSALSLLPACGGEDDGSQLPGEDKKDAEAKDGAFAPPLDDGGALPPSDASSDGAPTPALETVHYVGRFDLSDPEKAKFDWSGNAITAHFTGTAISVELRDHDQNFFQAILDGKVQKKFKGTTGTHVLATGLSAGEHTITLYRRTEPIFQETQFLGFKITGGALVPTAYPVTRRLEIVGDSISAGFGNEGAGPCAFTADTENAYDTYGAIAARAVSAEQSDIAWSGKGMTRNNDGTTTSTMPSIYKRTIAAFGGSVWNFSFAPDAIVINLATNDFANGDPGKEFVTDYTAFLASLRTRYPKARLYVALGPMLTGANLTKAKGYLEDVVAARKKAKDTNVAFLQFATQNAAADGVGCVGHPNVTTHKKMAAVLTAALKNDLGW